MSESPLSTHVGPIAVIAGGLFAVSHVGMIIVAGGRDMVVAMTDPLFQVFNGAYAIAFPLLVIALVAIYWRQARESGLFGAIAFCVAVTGTVALAGDMWFEGFAVPWLAHVAPAVFAADRSGSLLMAAWLVTVVLFSLGWTLFGLASFRARIMPRALSVALAVCGVIGFQAAAPPWGAPLGLAVAAVGIWWMRQDRIVPPLERSSLQEPVVAAGPR